MELPQGPRGESEGPLSSPFVYDSQHPRVL